MATTIGVNAYLRQFETVAPLIRYDSLLHSYKINLTIIVSWSIISANNFALHCFNFKGLNLATIEGNENAEGVHIHTDRAESSHDMTDILLTLGRLEERTKTLPTPGRQFGATFLGAAAVAALCIAIFVVWVPREIDGIKTAVAYQMTPQSQKLEMVATDVAEIKELTQTTLASVQSLHQNVSAMAIAQRQRDGRFIEMGTFVSGLDAKDELLLGAYTDDIGKMVAVISNLPEADRTRLFSIMAVGLLRDQLIATSNR